MGRRSAVGINNGNFRNGDYIAWALNDLSNVPTFEQSIQIRKYEEDLTGIMGVEEFQAWRETAPKGNAEFIEACLVKYTELTTQPHPVDRAQAVEREIDREMGKRMVVSATPAKVTVSRSWAERHLNVDVNGFTAELDKAFGKGNWTLA